MQGSLCIQCVDSVSGATGCFLAEPDVRPFRAITPIYSCLAEAFPALRESGWVSLPREPRYPCGLYELHRPAINQTSEVSP